MIKKLVINALRKIADAIENFSIKAPSFDNLTILMSLLRVQYAFILKFAAFNSTTIKDIKHWAYCPLSDFVWQLSELSRKLSISHPKEGLEVSNMAINIWKYVNMTYYTETMPLPTQGGCHGSEDTTTNPE